MVEKLMMIWGVGVEKLMMMWGQGEDDTKGREDLSTTVTVLPVFP